MAREGLLLDLRATIHKARKENAAVRKEGLRIAYNGRLLEVNIEVIPIGPTESEELHFLILFEEVPAGPPQPKEPQVAKSRKKETGARPANREVERLRSELAGTKDTLQAIIEEHESTNEELRAANEEIQSSNEELQSTNEELETAKEELQSTNEELTTLNEELENRNLELNQAINDLDNLLNTVNIPIVMLGRDLRIRTFTPLAEKVLKLIPADTGRPISELKLGIQVPDLEQQVLRVIETLDAEEKEVRAEDGCWYSVRIRPYRTTDDKIDGAVIALLDITERKRAEEALRDAQVYAQSIVATVRQPLVVLDAELRVVSANRAFYETFHVKPRDTENRLLYDLGDRQWDIPKLRTLLEEIIPENTEFHDFQVEHDFPEIGHKQLLLNARRIDQAGGRPQLILLAIEEVTDGQDTGS
jgi:two-component system CheB/CheR fusion protein